MIRIALSIATGLAHLHMEIVGTQGNNRFTIKITFQFSILKNEFIITYYVKFYNF